MSITWSRRTLWAMAGCVLGILAIAALDAVSGESLDLFILYFLPIYFAAWYGGRRSGTVTAVLSAASWLAVDYATRAPRPPFDESWDTLIRLTSFLAFTITLSRIRAGLDRERELNNRLTDALAEVKQLRGILPMCSICRRIRDSGQQWVRFETYIHAHTEAQVSHGLCPDCYKKYYGQLDGT